ncbi:hypothetical protein E4T56_gene6250, partial [Termitomyces sp. T112]
MDARAALMLNAMRAQLVEQAQMAALIDQVIVKRPQHRAIGKGILDKPMRAQRPDAIAQGLRRPGDHALKQAPLIDQRQFAQFAPVQRAGHRHLRSGQNGADKRAARSRMRPQQRKGVGMAAIQQGSDGGFVWHIAGIFADRAIGREPADIGEVVNGRLAPARLVHPARIDTALGLGIGIEISGHQEPVAVIKARHQPLVAITVIGAEHPAGNGLDRLMQFAVALNDGAGVIASGARLVHLVGGHAEDDDVFVTHMILDLDIRAIQRAD